MCEDACADGIPDSSARYPPDSNSHGVPHFRADSIPDRSAHSFADKGTGTSADQVARQRYYSSTHRISNKFPDVSAVAPSAIGGTDIISL